VVNGSGVGPQPEPRGSGGKVQRRPRDNYTRPWATAAIEHPDSWTTKLFWTVLGAAAATVMLDLSVSHAVVGVKVFGLEMTLSYHDVVKGMWILLAGFALIYLLLCIFEVVHWVGESNQAFDDYIDKQIPIWEGGQRGKGVRTNELPKPDPRDIALGALRMSVLLVPLIAAGTATVFVIW
jgi:hypothetical protein